MYDELLKHRSILEMIFQIIRHFLLQMCPWKWWVEKSVNGHANWFSISLFNPLTIFPEIRAPQGTRQQKRFVDVYK